MTKYYHAFLPPFYCSPHSSSVLSANTATTTTHQSTSLSSADNLRTRFLHISDKSKYIVRKPHQWGGSISGEVGRH
ncbi:hypothetical protein vseg_001922 [Gypsophila vaccaria]